MARSAARIDRISPAASATRVQSEMRSELASPWPSWLLAVLGILWLAGVTTFVMMSLAAHQYASFLYDTGISVWIQQVRGSALARVINPAGDLQWPVPTGIAMVIIFGTLVVFRFFREAICLAVATFGADATNILTNSLVARPRPHGGQIGVTLANLGQHSYPSGHVSHTVGLYGFLFFLCLLAERAQPRWRPWLIAVQVICAYFVLLVGVSRVLEGQHWPSDVAAGYLDGALWVLIGIALYHVLAERWPRRVAGAQGGTGDAKAR